MQENNNISETKANDQTIISNKELSIWEALIPVVILMGLLAYNIFLEDGEWFGGFTNQIILLIGGGVAMIGGL